MSSKIYTNAVLTFIAVLLALGIFKSNFNLPVETTAFAQSNNYKEYKLHYTTAGVGTNLDSDLEKFIKAGWKPIGIAQSSPNESVTSQLTVLLAR
jgi:uncharacterized membrane protein YadS